MRKGGQALCMHDAARGKLPSVDLCACIMTAARSSCEDIEIQDVDTRQNA